MDNIHSNFGDVFLWTFWIFVMIGAITIWVLAFIDVFADATLSGWAKAAWAIFLIFVPWISVLVYLVVREQRRRKLSASIRAGN